MIYEQLDRLKDKTADHLPSPHRSAYTTVVKGGEHRYRLPLWRRLINRLRRWINEH